MSHGSNRIATAFAVLALAVAPPIAVAQEPAPRIRLIELTPHLAVNDAAALIEAANYTDAIALLEEFNANQAEPVPEAFYLLGLAHYQLGDYVKARPAAERAAMLAPDAPATSPEPVVDLLKRAENHRAVIPWLG